MPGKPSRRLGEAREVRSLDAPGDQPDPFGNLLRGSVDQLLAVGDVGDVIALDRLVHVMGRDEHGHAVVGEAPDLGPEIAPRLRDRRRRSARRAAAGRVRATGRRPAPGAASSRRTALRRADGHGRRGRDRRARRRPGCDAARMRYMRADEVKVLADRQVRRRARISVSCSRHASLMLSDWRSECRSRGSFPRSRHPG